jgi:hypothetical protein
MFFAHMKLVIHFRRLRAISAKVDHILNLTSIPFSQSDKEAKQNIFPLTLKPEYLHQKENVLNTLFS